MLVNTWDYELIRGPYSLTILNHSQEHSSSFSPIDCNFESNNDVWLAKPDGLANQKCYS